MVPAHACLGCTDAVMGYAERKWNIDMTPEIVTYVFMIERPHKLLGGDRFRKKKKF